MNYNRGFTLLEMIVAISIFSIIAIVSYASLNRFLDQRDWIETGSESLKQLQISYLIIAQDLRRLSPRIVRDGYGDAEPLFIAMSPTDSANGEVLRFTTYKHDTSLPGLSTQVRVAYRLEGDELFRISWPVLDRDQDTPEYRQRLLSDIQSLQIDLIDTSNDEVQTLKGWTEPERLPDGIDLQITLDNGRYYQRIFEVRHGQ